MTGRLLQTSVGGGPARDFASWWRKGTPPVLVAPASALTPPGRKRPAGPTRQASEAVSNTFGRRLLLRAGLAAAAAPALRDAAFAAPGAAPGLLVLVSLRGGWDGLHVLSPADDAAFADLRAPELRTAATGDRAGLRLDATPGTDFRLHPEAAPLAALWQERRLALWPAAGVPEPTRSHFEAQALMGLGRGHRAEGADGPGWLGAWAERAAAGRGVAALAAGTGLPAELRGSPRALAVPGLEGGLLPPGGPFGAAVLEALYAPTPGPVGAAGRAALAALREADAVLPRDAAGRIPPPGPEYLAAGPFGRSLATVAVLARRLPGLAAAEVELGGWDTHEGQARRLAERLGVLSRGLAALDHDLRDLGRPWAVVVASEFGRRLRGNRSGGTDHGRAGLMLAFGGPGFALGRQFGPWPGLAPEALEDGTDLRVATDYRVALRAVLATLTPGGRTAAL